METNYKNLLSNVRAFAFDVDGVLTDGSLYLMQGEQYRVMNIRDGYALAAAIKADYRVFIISGGNSESVRTRLNGLGIEDVFLGVEDKVAVLKELMNKYTIKQEELLYMGDDLPDYEVIQYAGLRACPEDASPEIKDLCNYISPYNGGKGCVRDVIEQVLRSRMEWPHQATHYLTYKF
jgi:3-deoxy-D-manno-octulosonate 8-phosphate phosphatase (KDO 8-P phosphatase)